MKLVHWTVLCSAIGLTACHTTPHNKPELSLQKIYHAPAQIFDFDLSSTVLRGAVQLKQSCNAMGTSLDIIDQQQQQVRIDTFNLNNNLLFAGAILGTTVVDKDGKWSFTTTEELPEGTQAISYARQSQSYTRNLVSPITQFTVDKQAEAVYRPDTRQTIVVPNGGATRASRALIRGNGIPGETITIFNQSIIDPSLKTLTHNLTALYQQQYNAQLTGEPKFIKTSQGEAALVRLTHDKQNLDFLIQSRYGYAYVVMLNSSLIQNQAAAEQHLQTLLKSLYTPGSKIQGKDSHVPIRFDLSNNNADARYQWQQTYCS